MLKRNLLILLALVFITPTFGQNFLTYRPKIHVETARQYASENGIEDPLLIGVGTIVGPVEGLPIELTFSVNSGLATAWVYYFKSSVTSQNKMAVALFNIMVNMLPYDVTNVSLENFPNLPENEIIVDWMDTDEFCNNLLKNLTAKEFFEIPGSKVNIQYVALGINNEYDLAPKGETYWIINANSEEGEGPNLTCFTNAVTGETICAILNSIFEIESNHGLVAYPNPANSYTSIPLPENTSNINKIEAINSLGEIFSIDILSFSGDTIEINTEKLSNSTYMITVETANKIFVYPLIIQR